MRIYTHYYFNRITSLLLNFLHLLSCARYQENTQPLHSLYQNAPTKITTLNLSANLRDTTQQNFSDHVDTQEKRLNWSGNSPRCASKTSDKSRNGGKKVILIKTTIRHIP